MIEKLVSLLAKRLRYMKFKIKSSKNACYIVNKKRVKIMHRGTVADLGVIEQCFEHRQYEIQDNRGIYQKIVQNFYNKIIECNKIPLIIDCGANIGARVLWFSSMYPDAHIVAVEPASDNIEILRQNCRAYNVDIQAAAIGPRDGTTVLSDPGEGAWGYRTDDNVGSGYRVPVLSIATIMNGKSEDIYVPFILKIDIEGAEKSFFDVDYGAIDRFPLVIVEPHDWLFPGEQTSVGMFRFHVETKRDFSYHNENLFSIAYARLVKSGEFTVSDAH